MTLNAELERLLVNALATGGGTASPVEPTLALKIVDALAQAAQPIRSEGRGFAIVTSPGARRILLQMIKPRFPEIPVLSFEELPSSKAVEVIAIIGNDAEMIGDQQPISPDEFPKPLSENEEVKT